MVLPSNYPPGGSATQVKADNECYYGRMQSHPGTYALILRARRNEAVRVGRLGTLQVQPGYYVYVGSAFGPGGVRARIGHHSRIAERPRWHIDYLRARLDLIEVWYSFDPIRREGLWARLCQRLPRASVPMAGFGASDCRGETHLVFTPGCPRITALWRLIRETVDDHAPLHTHDGQP